MAIYNMIEDYLENGITIGVQEFIGALDGEELFELLGDIRQMGWEWVQENPTVERADNPFNDIYDYIQEVE